MVTIKNLVTGETKSVFNTEFANGYIKSNTGKNLGKRFANSWAGILTELKDADGQQAFMLSADWEVVAKAARKPRKTKETKKEELAADVIPAADVIKVEEVTEPAEEEISSIPATEIIPAEVKTIEEYEAEIAATYGSMGVGIFRKAIEYVQANFTPSALDESAVRRIASAIFAEYAAAEPEKMKVAKEAAKKASGSTSEVHCQKYDRILAKVGRGRRVYLYGPAGSGKSHTAEQIAADLGLTFYGQTTIQFAHDVRGYGDASGQFVDTPFYKAFAFGGLYFQDEYDRSNAEAAIVLNSALANGWYDFPVIGRVEAHPDFRFMAAGNTLMKGADDGYITGQEIDPSSRDRFDFYFEVGYLHEVELRIAHGNEDIVNFVEDVRQAIKTCGIEHVVSYRATAAMADEIENENDLEACCEEGIFKGLDVDARREIYAALQDKDSIWAKALKKTI